MKNTINILNNPEIERFKNAKYTWSTLINSLDLRNNREYDDILPDTDMPFLKQKEKYLQLSNLIFDEVLEKKGIFIADKENSDALSKYMLITQIANLAPIRIKRIASLLESKTSYSHIVKMKKQHNSLIGTFDEIYLITRIFSNVGWERQSRMRLKMNKHPLIKL